MRGVHGESGVHSATAVSPVVKAWCSNSGCGSLTQIIRSKMRRHGHPPSPTHAQTKLSPTVQRMAVGQAGGAGLCVPRLVEKERGRDTGSARLLYMRGNLVRGRTLTGRVVTRSHAHLYQRSLTWASVKKAQTSPAAVVRCVYHLTRSVTARCSVMTGVTRWHVTCPRVCGEMVSTMTSVGGETQVRPSCCQMLLLYLDLFWLWSWPSSFTSTNLLTSWPLSWHCFVDHFTTSYNTFEYYQYICILPEHFSLLVTNEILFWKCLR